MCAHRLAETSQSISISQAQSARLNQPGSISQLQLADAPVMSASHRAPTMCWRTCGDCVCMCRRMRSVLCSVAWAGWLRKAEGEWRRAGRPIRLPSRHVGIVLRACRTAPARRGGAGREWRLSLPYGEPCVPSLLSQSCDLFQPVSMSDVRLMCRQATSGEGRVSVSEGVCTYMTPLSNDTTMSATEYKSLAAVTGRPCDQKNETDIV